MGSVEFKNIGNNDFLTSADTALLDMADCYCQSIIMM
jgi:hypothetical protein